MTNKLGILATTAMIFLSGCGPSYEGVKPSVIKPITKSIYDIDLSSNADFYSKKLNTYEGDIAVLDLKMIKNSKEYPVTAYVNTYKTIIVRYQDPVKAKTPVDDAEYEAKKTVRLIQEHQIKMFGENMFLNKNNMIKVEEKERSKAESGELLFHSAVTGKNVFDMKDAHFVYIEKAKKLAYFDVEKFSNKKIKGIKYLHTKTAIKKVFILPNTEAKKLLTVTQDNKIVLWNVNKKIKLEKILLKNSSSIHHVEISSSGRYLSYTDQSSLHILDLTDNAKELVTFAVKDITALNFSPKERKLAVATKNSQILEYSLSEKKEIRRFSCGYKEYANGISYTDNAENILVTASNLGYLKTWVLIANTYTLKIKNTLVTHSPDIRDHCAERNKFVNAWYSSRKESSFYKKYAPVETECSLFGSKEQVVDFANKGILNKYLESYVESMHLTPEQIKQYKTDLRTNLQVRNWFLALNGGQYYGVSKIAGKIFAYGTGHRGHNFKFKAVVIDKTKPSLFAQASILNSYGGVMKNYTYDIGKKDSFFYDYYNALDQYDFLAINKFTSDHEYHGTYLRVNSDKKNIIFAAKANKVEIWDTTSQPKLQNIILENGEISALAYNKENNILAIGSSNTMIKLWDLNSMKIIGKLSGHTYKIRSLAFFENGKKLISSGYYDKSVRIWDTNTMKTIKTFTYKCRSVQEVHIAPDQKSFAVDIRIKDMIEHSIINIYDSKTYALKQVLNPQIGYIREFAYSDDGATIYAVSAGIALEKQRLHRFSKIDLTTNKTKVYKFNPNFRFVTGFLVIESEKSIVFSGTDGNLLVLDLDTLREIKTIDMGTKGSYNSIPSLSMTHNHEIVTGSKINNINMFSFH